MKLKNKFQGPKEEKSWRDFFNELALLYMNGDYKVILALEIFILLIGIFVIMGYFLVL